MEYFPLQDFSGGVDRATHPLRISDTMCLQTKNLVPAFRGVLARRRGLFLCATIDPNVEDSGITIDRVLAGKSFPDLGFEVVFCRTHDTYGRIWDKIYILHPSSHSYIEGGLHLTPSNDHYSIVEFMGKVYFGSNNIVSVYYAGGSPLPAQFSTGSVTPTGNYLIVWRDRLWVANDTTVAYSDNLDPTTFQADSAVTPRKSQGDNDKITGLGIATMTTATETVASLLVIFKEHSIWTLSFDTEPQSLDQLSGKIGCCSADTITPTPYGLMWSDRDNVYLMNQGEPTEVGNFIRPVLDGTDSDMPRNTSDFFLRRNRAIFHNGFYRLSFASNAITSEDSFRNDTEWWLDLRFGPTNFSWYGNHTSGMGAYWTTGATLYSGSSTSGKIYEYDKLIYQDDSTNYEIRLKTKYYAPESEYMTKKFKRFGLGLASQLSTTMYVDYSIDQGNIIDADNAITVTGGMALWDSAVWDSSRWDSIEPVWVVKRIFLRPQDRGKFINFELHETSDSLVLMNNGLLAYLKTGRIL